MHRRDFLRASTGAMLLPTFLAHTKEAVALTRLQTIHSNWREFVPQGLGLPQVQTPLELTHNQWREQLSEDAFRVLFHDDTEPPGTSPLDKQWGDGIYVCAACELPLFSSAMKFDSGTGWPSFFTHIPDHMDTKRDFKLIIPRTEYHCIRCKGHQGHVFDDGPAPTNERWCNNGVALRFIAVRDRKRS